MVCDKISLEVKIKLSEDVFLSRIRKLVNFLLGVQTWSLYGLTCMGNDDPVFPNSLCVPYVFYAEVFPIGIKLGKM